VDYITNLFSAPSSVADRKPKGGDAMNPPTDGPVPVDVTKSSETTASLLPMGGTGGGRVLRAETVEVGSAQGQNTSEQSSQLPSALSGVSSEVEAKRRKPYPPQEDGYVTPTYVSPQPSLDEQGNPLWSEHLSGGHLGPDKSMEFNENLKLAAAGKWVLSKEAQNVKIAFISGFRNEDTEHRGYWDGIMDRLKNFGIHDAEVIPTPGVRTSEHNAVGLLSWIRKNLEDPKDIVLVPHSKGAIDLDVALSRNFMEGQGLSVREMEEIENRVYVGSLQGVHGFAHESNDAMTDSLDRRRTIRWVTEDLKGDPAVIDQMTYFGRTNTRLKYPINKNIKYFSLATYDGVKLDMYSKLARDHERKYRVWRDFSTGQKKEIDAKNDGRLFKAAQIRPDTPWATVDGPLHDIPWNSNDRQKSADLLETLIQTVIEMRH
jgi:hypothetical protein